MSNVTTHTDETGSKMDVPYFTKMSTEDLRAAAADLGVSARNVKGFFPLYLAKTAAAALLGAAFAYWMITINGRSVLWGIVGLLIWETLQPYRFDKRVFQRVRYQRKIGPWLLLTLAGRFYQTLIWGAVCTFFALGITTGWDDIQGLTRVALYGTPVLEIYRFSRRFDERAAMINDCVVASDPELAELARKWDNIRNPEVPATR